MAELQTLIQNDFDGKKPINFTPHELELLKGELDKQFADGNGVNVFKSLYIVRYSSIHDKCQRQLEKEKRVTFDDDEWEAFIETQEICFDD